MKKKKTKKIYKHYKYKKLSIALIINIKKLGEKAIYGHVQDNIIIHYFLTNFN